ncbi:MAG: aminotransferase class III-fold pyridoxal phosphate-dependent enzyme [Chloroflexota bacterium]
MTETNQPISTLLANTPTFTPHEAARLAATHYGFESSAKPLDSERDQNFLLTKFDGTHYVLKIANALESRSFLECQNQAIACTQSVTPNASQIISSMDGVQIVEVSGPNNEHFMRLLTYVPGKPLGATKPHSPALLHNLGEVLAKMDATLADFDHPDVHRKYHWDLKHASQTVETYLPAIEDDERRDLVQKFLTRYQLQSADKVQELRQAVIQSDANDYNVLVEMNERGDQHVSGIIDFGDMVHTSVVCEVAIAVAYVMLNKVDPLTAAANVVRGYHSVYPLTEDELAVLFDLICMRLCTSVVMAAQQIKSNPDNDYLLISNQPAWRALEQLDAIHPNFAHYMFRSVCDLEPCPQTPAIVAWIKANQDQFALPTDHFQRSQWQWIIDLSVDSPVLAKLPPAPEEFPLTDLIESEMRGSGFPVGRYDEARTIYGDGIFECERDGYSERRTLHIGMDFFGYAGDDVYAVCEGRVHSLGYNPGKQDYGHTVVLEHVIQDEAGEEITFYTLYGHLNERYMWRLQKDKLVRAGDRVGKMGKPSENGGWTPHLHFQILTDMFGEEHTCVGVAPPSERTLWKSISPDPNLMAQLPEVCFGADSQELSSDAILTMRQKHISPSFSISYNRPLHMVRGWQQYLYSDTGQPYLDGVNNVCHVGHSHPEVVAAGHAQMTVLNTNTRYLHPNLVAYAQRLCAMLPDPLNVCFFVCTGSEANDLALRIARTHTGQQDVITLDAAYHGHTQALIEVSPYKFAGKGGQGAPDYVHTALMPDLYRGVYKRDDPQAGQKYADHVQEIIAGLQAQDKGIAAFIGESVLGCGGQVVLPDGYFEAAYAHVRAAGGVCIADEVQVGFGRVGSHFWGFETQGVVPDIVTMGKPIGNGHPIGAVVTTPELAASFANGMEYFNTFGGNPVSCAIGLAVLDAIQFEDMQENAHEVGTYLMTRLRSLMDRHPIIGDVRGLGLFIGIELVLDRETLEPAAIQASYIANRTKDYGILISTDGPLHNVLKLKPPLVWTIADADLLVDVLDQVLAEDFVRL